VIRSANELGVASMPGTHTATEMLLAHQAGATFCKLFPAPASGPAYIKAILGPLPFLKIVPTSGVDHYNAAEWIAAGAYGVGFVAPLFEPVQIGIRLNNVQLIVCERHETNRSRKQRIANVDIGKNTVYSTKATD